MKQLTESNLIETCVFSSDFPELAAQGIWRIGYTTVSKSHDRPSTARDERFGHVHVTLAGSAQVLTGQGWRKLRAGQAYVCPPGEQSLPRPHRHPTVHLPSETPVRLGNGSHYMTKI